jgi:hypothetical protein
MSIFAMLYLQDPVDQKLHKELQLRNLVAHIALSKQLHKIQMEHDVDNCVPAGKKSESFAKFLTRNQPETNTSSSAASISDVCEQYGAMTLYEQEDKREIS